MCQWNTTLHATIIVTLYICKERGLLSRRRREQHFLGSHEPHENHSVFYLFCGLPNIHFTSLFPSPNVLDLPCCAPKVPDADTKVSTIISRIPCQMSCAVAIISPNTHGKSPNTLSKNCDLAIHVLCEVSVKNTHRTWLPNTLSPPNTRL